MKQLFFLIILTIQIFFVQAQNLNGVKIYINPGHGGNDGDDRNVVIAPFSTGDKNGFWESQSNLDKGLQLRSLLESAGATVNISRTTNTTADDLPLSQIVTMANTAQADFFLSIHSNAGNGVANHVLMLHVGVDPTDSQTYNTFNPANPAHALLSTKSREISTEIAKNIYSNQITTWSSGYSVRGDKTFARTAMGWSDGYGVLRGLYVPGVISEGAMHDYIPETYRLMNMEYKYLEAWIFFKSFTNYFNGGQIPKGLIAGQVRDSRIKNEATYNKFAGNDQMLPLNGAKLTLIETGETYTVDNFQNGVFAFKNLTPGLFHVKAEKEGYYSRTQEINLTAHNISYFNFALNRVRNTPPQVIAYEPNTALTDSVNASTSISITFNWDMDTQTTEQAFSISPAMSGKFTWEDSNYRMRFTPDKPLERSTVYTITLNKSASHPDNLSMTSDFSFQFKTKSRNRLSLIAAYPFDGNKGVHYNNPSFRLIFDKKLKTSNLATTIKVLDETNTVITKSTRTVVNNSVVSPYGSSYFNLSQNLVAGKEYTLVIDGEVMDEDELKVVEPIQIKFKAVDVAKNFPETIDTFESLNYGFTPDLSTGVTNATVSTSTTKLFGSYSNKFTASFTDSPGSALFGLLNPMNVSSDKVIGLHLFGDLTGNEVWLQFRIPGGVQYLKLCDLNFFGWEFHEVDLSSLPDVSDWTLTGLKIERKNLYLFSSTSDILLDNMLLYDEPILSVSNVKADYFSIYPNPASEVIHIKGIIGTNAKLEIYMINGSLVKEAVGDKITITDIESGTYILKIKDGDKQAAYPVFINH